MLGCRHRRTRSSRNWVPESGVFGSGRGLSQEAFADLARLDRSYMSGIERGVRNCSVLNLAKIARALSVAPGSLFDAD